MDSSAGLGLRYTLYTVYTGLVFHDRISTLSVDHEGYTLHAADTDLIRLHHFYFPSSGLCIVYVHTENLGCEEGCLVSSCTCTNLHDNVLVIIRVFRKKENLQFFLQLHDSFLCLGKLFLQHLPHFLVGFALQHGNALFLCLLTFFILCIGRYQRLQIGLFLHELPEPVLIIYHRRLCQFVGNLFIPSYQVFQFIKHVFPPLLLRLASSIYDPVKACQVLYYMNIFKILLHICNCTVSV